MLSASLNRVTKYYQVCVRAVNITVLCTLISLYIIFFTNIMQLCCFKCYPGYAVIIILISFLICIKQKKQKIFYYSLENGC
ncbi:MAG: hypothetical protein A2309_02460 [Bacteroidetes bacterium RIFOXYB2_FULL_35_7]|nr:MAG: hypothetical protein A2309_02460 [Bacteroidetes bacterium RIFOXYB2_FULL_35_7]